MKMSRRSLVRGSAWAVPTIAATVAAPAFAASSGCGLQVTVRGTIEMITGAGAPAMTGCDDHPGVFQVSIGSTVFIKNVSGAPLTNIEVNSSFDAAYGVVAVMSVAVFAADAANFTTSGFNGSGTILSLDADAEISVYWKGLYSAFSIPCPPDFTATQTVYLSGCTTPITVNQPMYGY